LRRVDRERPFSQEKLAKPNVFRTLRGLETLALVSSGQFRHRVQLALGWIEQQVEDGWFWMWMEE